MIFRFPENAVFAFLQFEFIKFANTYIFDEIFFSFCVSLQARTRAKKIKMRYEKVRLRFGKDVMVRPNYSVLDIGDSVRPNPKVRCTTMSEAREVDQILL